ncbi:hypothetical protein [Mycolicibacterium sp. YH-1]|uniref:hypothetical protein n=1 Tax=Mycolicibacterium sp. YH-1 TaxID=2908837 RepID=UPI001F4BD40A|nr:hypothetical protein [Mycolicibacterium sp. YH-1]UNB55479.1 hypothetical protein L0M16_14900 [Mycolicibacterium sp. YH-1]
MARLKSRAVEAGLREFLLEKAIAFRELCGQTPEMYAELLTPVDALIGDEPYRLYRWELPDDHPERAADGPNDGLVLTADDKLRPGE